MAEAKLPFDKAIIADMRRAAEAVLADHLELRSVAVSLDFSGALNDARGVSRGLWIGEDGPVTGLDAVIGSAQVTLEMLREQYARGEALVAQLRDEAQVLGTELAERKGRLGAAVDDETTDADSASAVPEPGDH